MPRALAEDEPFAVEIEGAASLGGHRREPHEPEELKLLDQVTRARHDDVRAPRADAEIQPRSQWA